MTDDNGLYYMRARYYSPDLMRFVNADPLTQSIAKDPYQNVYAYANGNPISYVDPFGTSATLGHTALDAAGFIPGIGMLFDGMNALWYLAEGDFTNAGLSAVALVPIIGDAAGVVGAGIKIVSKADDVIDAAKVAENVAEGAGKSLTNGAKMTTNKALDAADGFLGAGYKEVAAGVFRSKDGLRQVRMTDADITGAHGGGAHMNFETGKSITNQNGRVTFKVNDNIHIYLTD